MIRVGSGRGDYINLLEGVRIYQGRETHSYSNWRCQSYSLGGWVGMAGPIEFAPRRDSLPGR